MVSQTENSSTHPDVSDAERQEAALYQLRQAELDKRLQRSHFWRIYFPIGLVSIILAVLAILLIWVTQVNQVEQRGAWTTFASSSADLIIIYTLLPLMLLCAVLPAGITAIWFYSQRQGVSVYRFLLKYIRMSDRYLQRADRQVKQTAPAAVKQVATYRGWIAYGQSFFENVRLWLFPKEENSNGNS